MSQKAWMQAYTKGSKALQARIAKVHANNPEFQEFVKKHGFGGNLSVKQSGQQKTSSVATVKPVTDPHPERSNLDREAMIKAAAEKLRNRRLANANRVAFGGELGGGFQMPGGGFRRYSEETELNELSDKRLTKYVKKAEKSADRLAYYSDSRNDPDWIKSNKRDRMIAVAKRKLGEDIAYKDGTIAMYRGGWIAKRGDKRLGNVMPTDQHARDLLDATRKSLAQKTMTALKSKARAAMRGFGIKVAKKPRRAWDAAILPEEQETEN